MAKMRTVSVEKEYWDLNDNDNGNENQTKNLSEQNNGCARMLLFLVHFLAIL